MRANKSNNKFDLVIFDNRRVLTYVELINQNLILIKKLIHMKNKNSKPFNPNKLNDFFIPRSKHLQVMTLIGLTSEHIIKLILLKRNYCINIVGQINRRDSSKINQEPMISFSNNFLSKIRKFNANNNIQYLNQNKLNQLYLDAKKDILSNKVEFSSETYNFNTCIKKFQESNKLFHKKYLDFITKYDIYKKYLGFNSLNKNNCLQVIRASRNKYIHLADSQNEEQGIYWFMYNYLISILKIDFPDYFKTKKLIGGHGFIKKHFR